MLMTVSNVFLTLFILISLNGTTAQDVHVVCYNVSMEMGEDECAPVNQLESIDSYIDCCTLQDRDSVSTLRYTIEEEQCTFCGPVLKESLFFPELLTHDNSTIFIHWGLHPHSLPATHYMLSVGLNSEEGVEVTDILLEAQESTFTRHQFTPVIAGKVYTITIIAMDKVRDVSSPSMSIVWRIGDDILPTFTGFSTSFLTHNAVIASWSVSSPGLRPISHLTVQWVEVSTVEDTDDLYDPTSSAYPLANIGILEYDVWNTTQVVMQYDIIIFSLRNMVVNKTYYVGITGTNILGSKTTVFEFTAEMNDTLTEPETSGEAHATTLPSFPVMILLLSLCIHPPTHSLSPLSIITYY